FRSRRVLPFHGEAALTSISSTRTVLPCSLSMVSRKPTTCGRMSSLAMRRPPIWLGETVELGRRAACVRQTCARRSAPRSAFSGSAGARSPSPLGCLYPEAGRRSGRRRGLVRLFPEYLLRWHRRQRRAFPAECRDATPSASEYFPRKCPPPREEYWFSAAQPPRAGPCPPGRRQCGGPITGQYGAAFCASRKVS